MTTQSSPSKLLDPSAEVLESIARIPTLENFLANTDPISRDAMRKALVESLQFYLAQNRPVYLSGLGIFFNRDEVSRRSHIVGDRVFVREETSRKLIFEKCDDSGTLQRSDYPGLVNDTELSGTVYAHLPLQLQLLWSKKEFGFLLRRLIRIIREEAILEGASYQLSKLGVLYAFHSRQGRTPGEWFAGADMLFWAEQEYLIDVGDARSFQRPILANAFEPLEAAYGKPLARFEVDLGKELSELGYDRSEFERSCPLEERKFRMAVFLDLSERSPKAGKLIYATDGLRFLAKESDVPGTELTFQLATRDIQPFENVLDPAELPDWPARVFTLGWIMLQSRKSRTLATKLVIQADLPITKSNKDRIKCLLTTDFNSIRTQQLTERGEFKYINLLGLAREEIQAFGAEHSDRLFILLEYRKLDQVTRLGRPLLTASMASIPQLLKGSLKTHSVNLGQPSNSDSETAISLHSH